MVYNTCIGLAYGRRQITETNQNGSKFENENTGHQIQNRMYNIKYINASMCET